MSTNNMTSTRFAPLSVILLAALLQAAPALAAPVSEAEIAAAEALFEQARTLMQAARYAEACPKFEESQRLDPASGTLINLAECYEKQGRIASAWGRYLEAAALAQASGNAERERVARSRAEALRPRLPKLAISVVSADLPGLEILRDGDVVGRPQWGIEVPVDPGEHVIEARAPGHNGVRTAVTASVDAPAIRLTVPALTPVQAASPQPAAAPASAGLGTQRIAAIVAGAIGVVGVGVGTGFGLSSKAKHDESYEICPSDPCTEDAGREAMVDARTAGTISTVSFIVGGLGLASGAILWLTAKDAPEDAPRLAVGLGKIELRGRF